MNKFNMFTLFVAAFTCISSDLIAFEKTGTDLYFSKGNLKEVSILDKEGHSTVYTLSPYIDSALLQGGRVYLDMGVGSLRAKSPQLLGLLEKDLEFSAVLIEEKFSDRNKESRKENINVVLQVPRDARMYGELKPGTKELIGLVFQHGKEKRIIRVKLENEANVISEEEAAEIAEEKALNERVAMDLEKAKAALEKKDYKSVRVIWMQLITLKLWSNHFRSMVEVINLLPKEETPYGFEKNFSSLSFLQRSSQSFQELFHRDLWEMTEKEFSEFLSSRPGNVWIVPRSKHLQGVLQIIESSVHANQEDQDHERVIKDTIVKVIVGVIEAKIVEIDQANSAENIRWELRSLFDRFHAQYVVSESAAKDFVQVMKHFEDLKKSNWPHYGKVQEPVEDLLRKIVRTAMWNNNRVVMKVLIDSGIDLSAAAK